jgi:small redox-active disulfide protein 2
MLNVKVLGPGCPNCENVEANVRTAASNLGIEIELNKVKDQAEFHRYGLLATPGLVINEKLVCAGRIPDQGEIMSWLADALTLIGA